MLKCPFCHFDNEDGALFCEQCKSDLGIAEPAMAAPAAAAVETPQIAEAVPFVPDASPKLEMPIPAEAPIAAIASLDFLAAPVVAPMAEFAPLAPIPGIPVDTSALAPDLSQAEAFQAIDPAPVTMPASAMPPAGSMVDDELALPQEARPRLLVLRGQKRNVEYPIYDGHNFIGRADEKPVDIDLEDQEPPDRIWCSRQHALITLEDRHLAIEDLNSANGTFVNRSRIYPGQKRPLAVNDVVQIGNVQLKVIV
jgi:hypothetical protein